MQILAKWEDYATIKEWKKGLKYNFHKNQLSPKTLESMRVWMPPFLEYAQKNPNDDGVGPTTIEVSEKTVAKHLAHGDSLGPCVETPVCGNGVVKAPEACDDGNLISGDGCSEFCEAEAS